MADEFFYEYKERIKIVIDELKEENKQLKIKLEIANRQIEQLENENKTLKKAITKKEEAKTL